MTVARWLRDALDASGWLGILLAVGLAAGFASPAQASTPPPLPPGVHGTFTGLETGAQMVTDPGWLKSMNTKIPLTSDCEAWSPAVINRYLTYLQLHTPQTPSWDCAAVESTATFTPGHIYQLREYIPAMPDGLIADYPSWWLIGPGWDAEIDMAEARAWANQMPLTGEMCLDLHLDQGTVSTTPNCVTQRGGWRTYTLVWPSDGTVTVYYGGTRMLPDGVAGTTATDMHMVIWNNNDGWSGAISSTVKVAYLATWTTS